MAVLDTTVGSRFANDTLALEAAMNGLGVAIAHQQVAERWIGEGRLAAPFDVSVPGKHGYYLVYPEASSERDKIIAFRKRLLSTLANGDAE